MAMKETMDSMAKQQVKQRDDMIMDLIKSRIGSFFLGELSDRLQVLTRPDETEEWVLDGRPLVVFGKPELTMKKDGLSYTATLTRKVWKC
jgi:hypothetical protein